MQYDAVEWLRQSTYMALPTGESYIKYIKQAHNNIAY